MGIAVGLAVGIAVGWAVGVAVGLAVGVAVGWAVGVAVGLAVGIAVGTAVGVAVGFVEGLPVGLLVDFLFFGDFAFFICLFSAGRFLSKARIDVSIANMVTIKIKRHLLIIFMKESIGTGGNQGYHIRIWAHTL